ncbi:hypothetical protein [Streptomyces clavifer]|uniref:hypothetical protein n=1 Tax=Streptomyces clavifer TaxID=68188 RepID=UPI0036B6F637
MAPGARPAAEKDEAGRRLVVRIGRGRPRTVTTTGGQVEVTAPRVNDRRADEATGERARLSLRILPPWCRRSPKISEVLPLLCLLCLHGLHGLPSGDFAPALEHSWEARPGCRRRR